MDEEDEYSSSEFYYPEDLETFDVETETSFTQCHIINNLLTELAWVAQGNIGPRLCSVRTATTSGQYSPVRSSRSVSISHFPAFTYFAPFPHFISHVYIALRPIFSYITNDAVDRRKLRFLISLTAVKGLIRILILKILTDCA